MTTNDKQLSIYCDGGARGNPGPAACAFVATSENGQLIHQQGFYLGVATNNQAEYRAVIESLKWLSTLKQESIIVNFYLDSQLVVNQINGNYKIKNVILEKLNSQIKKMIIENKIKIEKIVYIPRVKNFAADSLVNQTLNKIPFSHL